MIVVATIKQVVGEEREGVGVRDASVAHTVNRRFGQITQRASKSCCVRSSVGPTKGTKKRAVVGVVAFPLLIFWDQGGAGYKVGPGPSGTGGVYYSK